jgi:hypothetical protein
LSEAEQAHRVKLLVAAQEPGWEPSVGVQHAQGGAQDLWSLAS